MEMSPLSSSDLNSSAIAWGLAIGHAMILALEKEQRPVVASESTQHFTHDNGMIAAFVTLHNLALEMADGAIQDGGAVTAFVPGQAGKLIGALGGKAARDLFLIFVEKVNCKYVGFNEA